MHCPFVPLELKKAGPRTVLAMTHQAENMAKMLRRSAADIVLLPMILVRAHLLEVENGWGSRVVVLRAPRLRGRVGL